MHIPLAVHELSMVQQEIVPLVSTREEHLSVSVLMATCSDGLVPSCNVVRQLTLSVHKSKDRFRAIQGITLQISALQPGCMWQHTAKAHFLYASYVRVAKNTKFLAHNSGCQKYIHSAWREDGRRTQRVGFFMHHFVLIIR